MVTFSESFQTFLKAQQAKGNRVAHLICEAILMGDIYAAYKRLLSTDEVNYVTMRTDGLISYLPAGKEHQTNERGEWMREGRQSGKPSKIIRKVFNPKVLRLIPAVEFENFGNAYKAKFMDNGFKFLMRPNTEIGDVYNMKRAEGEAGLNASCMNGDGKYLSIYESCEHVRILTLVNKNDLLCGRALVWNVKHKTHGDITFMDRLYVTEDYMFDLFLTHAKENGWWRKEQYKKYDGKTRWVNPDTDEVEEMVVKIYTETDHDLYPYIDTFAYGDDGWLSNSSGGTSYTYNETSGAREGDERYENDNHDDEIYDDFTDEWISQDDAVQISESYGNRRWRGRWSYHANTVHALVCGRDREYLHENDDDLIRVDDDWYVKGHEDIVYDVDGEYRLMEECTYCETDSEYYHDTDDLIQSEAGDWYNIQNDDRVQFVHTLNSDDPESGEYMFLPDVEEDVINVECGSYYYAKDKRIKSVDFHMGESCTRIHALKINLIKWRNRYYHKDDVRLLAKQLPITFKKSTKRKAQLA